ncbi:MAG: TetR/AcrR family transcriptional regulator [Alphaproteobacteria bacterium]|nr:TetR/AcrR family transcriptional regulator [Alphaproteobacteria bacterium]
MKRPQTTLRKQRRAPAERPREILAAALALFVEKGFAATRLDDVAARAGLSKAAIYLYFADKTALFQGVVRQEVISNFGTVEAMLGAHKGPVGDVLPRILDFLAGRIEETPVASIAKIVVSESLAFPEIGRFYLNEVIGRGIPIMEGLIARGIAQGEFRKVDPGLTVRSIMGAMLLAGVWRTVFEPIGAVPLDVRALARHHADLMLHALRPEKAGPS